MTLPRRQFLLASLGLVVGCQESARRTGGFGDGTGLVGQGSQGMSVAWTPIQETPRPVAYQSYVPKPADPILEAPLEPSWVGFNPIPRSQWTRVRPAGNINPMQGVNRITLHHEGNQAVNFVDESNTMDRLELIRRSHTSHRGWADIGYHFIVDRAGRVWEGRPLAFQGAHVSENNPHNVGVMVLGNFDIQRPSDVQIQAMQGTIRHLRRQFRVAPNQIWTHRELGRTSCPGDMLQPVIHRMRSNGQFV